MSLLDEDIGLNETPIIEIAEQQISKILHISKKDLWQYNNGIVEFNGRINDTSYIPTILSNDIQQPILAFEDTFTQGGNIKIPGLNVEYNPYNIQRYLSSSQKIDISDKLKEIGVYGIKFPSFIDKIYYAGPIQYNGCIRNSNNIKIIRELDILGQNSSATNFNLLKTQFPDLNIIYDLYVTGSFYLHNERPIKDMPVCNIILYSDLGRYEGAAAFDYGPLEGRFIHMTIDEFIYKIGRLRGRNIKNINKIHDMDTFKLLSLIHILIEFFKNNPNVKDIFYKDISIKSLLHYYYDYSEV